MRASITSCPIGWHAITESSPIPPMRKAPPRPSGRSPRTPRRRSTGATWQPPLRRQCLQPLPEMLADATVTVTDSGGTARKAPLYYASPAQINFLVPDGTAPGVASVAISNGVATQTFQAAVQNVAPTLFSMSGTGTGVAAATRRAGAGRQSVPPIACLRIPMRSDRVLGDTDRAGCRYPDLSLALWHGHPRT
ncbi:MAG: hypothetical protein WDO73_09770 [Ignavibacteriota bacterium]